MSKLHRGNRNLIKAMNRNLILNIVRQKGPLSRTQLTQLSHLSVGSVSQISNELIDENWLISGGESEYTGGRRQEMLRLNPNAGHVMGIKLMEDRIICVITDLEGKILFHTEQPLSYDHSVEAISNALAETVDSSIEASKLQHTTIKGLTIALAGVIDHTAGIVHYSPYFHWQDIPLAAMVAEQVTFPVYLENDANTLTVSEQLFGEGREVDNFVTITIGRGIGMGMVFDHHVYQGKHGGVGELGHLTIDERGRVCDCGKRGCLEALAADPAVIDYVEEQLTSGIYSSLESPVTPRAIHAAASEGDALAIDAYQRSGHYLGIGVSMVINLLRPEMIVLNGDHIEENDPRVTAMMKAIEKHTFNGLLDGLDIVIKTINELAWARGAASVVVGKLFELERVV